MVKDLPNKEFKVMVIRIFTNIRRTMWKQSVNFTKETFLFDTLTVDKTTKLKNVVMELGVGDGGGGSNEEFKSRLFEAEERIRKLKDWVEKMQKSKKIALGTRSSRPIFTL